MDLLWGLRLAKRFSISWTAILIGGIHGCSDLWVWGRCPRVLSLTVMKAKCARLVILSLLKTLVNWLFSMLALATGSWCCLLSSPGLPLLMCPVYALYKTKSICYLCCYPLLTLQLPAPPHTASAVSFASYGPATALSSLYLDRCSALPVVLTFLNHLFFLLSSLHSSVEIHGWLFLVLTGLLGTKVEIPASIISLNSVQ